MINLIVIAGIGFLFLLALWCVTKAAAWLATNGAEVIKLALVLVLLTIGFFAIVLYAPGVPGYLKTFAYNISDPIIRLANN